MSESVLVVTHPFGLHIRPANALFQAAQGFRCSIMLLNLDRPGGPEVDAKHSMFDIFTLGVSRGQRLLVRTEGEDAGEALAAISALVQNNFGDT
jgi:phosphotransferase system HPr (HPr) family protein